MFCYLSSPLPPVIGPLWVVHRPPWPLEVVLLVWGPLGMRHTVPSQKRSGPGISKERTYQSQTLNSKFLIRKAIFKWHGTLWVYVASHSFCTVSASLQMLDHCSYSSKTVAFLMAGCVKTPKDKNAHVALSLSHTHWQKNISCCHWFRKRSNSDSGFTDDLEKRACPSGIPQISSYFFAATQSIDSRQTPSTGLSVISRVNKCKGEALFMGCPG